MMNSLNDLKIILITQKTRLEDLIYRYNTREQAQFFIEHSGGDFSDYEQEHRQYHEALRFTLNCLQQYGRVQQVEKSYLPHFIFGKEDVVVALGRDGLVANALKYLSTQKLIGINPDPLRWEGLLVAFHYKDLSVILRETLSDIRKTQDITLAEATLNNGQSLCAVNDLFIGQKSHVSAQYEIRIGAQSEFQSSSGVIVSTGLGKTGWFKSILAGAGGIDRYFGMQGKIEMPADFRRDSNFLYYTVREPYPGKTTGAQLVFGKIEQSKRLQIASFMPENGVIFSDGMEADYLEFNSGCIATIGVSEKKGHLVV